MDTTTQTGDEVCITVSVSTPTSGDVDLTNNIYEFCYEAVNSYDPNKKLTTPEHVLPNYQDDFTYTIYFQNTGSAPAFNVRLADTLSSNLDLSTFRVVAGSHPYTYSLNAVSRLLTVRYANIMLVDSTSDLAGSIGYIQYKAKPVANLGNGSIIENTAYIYFDFNAPIITNTTENVFVVNVGIKENNLEDVSIYPNPSNGLFTIRFDNNATREVFITDLMGKVIYKQNCTSASHSLALNDISAGVYNVSVIAENGAKITKRIIVQAK